MVAASYFFLAVGRERHLFLHITSVRGPKGIYFTPDLILSDILLRHYLVYVSFKSPFFLSCPSTDKTEKAKAFRFIICNYGYTLPIFFPDCHRCVYITSTFIWSYISKISHLYSSRLFCMALSFSMFAVVFTALSMHGMPPF